MTDITVILNAHSEGSMAHYSCLSLKECIDFATDKGLIVEAIAVLDNPTQETIDYFNEQNYSWLKVVVVKFQDIGLSRNHGATIANGKYIAFLDGDDLFGYNWLFEAHSFCSKQFLDVICHPELNFNFGEKVHYFVHEDSTSENFDKWEMSKNNYWTSLVFLKRSVFLSQLQINVDMKSGWGHEDWHWHCETIANKFSHRVIKNTAHFIRAKGYGRLENANSNNCLVPATTLFDPDLISANLLRFE